MAETPVHRLIIVGAGPAGLTAGMYAARANLEPVIIEGKNPGGQLMGTTAVENWPGEKSIQGPELMAKMRAHTQAFGCTFQSGSIDRVDFSKKPFTLWTHKNKELKAQSVIIATGATPKKLSIPGEAAYWGKGVTTCAVCDGALYKDKPVVIIGGGDTAMEDASFMTNFTDQITIVQIKESLTASQAMQKRVLNNPKITILYSTAISGIEGDEKQVTNIVVTNLQTKEQTSIPANAVFVAIGLSPNTDFLKGQLELTDFGYIVEKGHTKTSVPGVFVAGDVSDPVYRQAITSAGTGCAAALEAERYLKE